MLELEKKIKDIMLYFSWVESTVELNNSFSFTDINISLESLILKLLNILGIENYENCNNKKINYPTIDLIDSKKKIGIQITSEATATKIKETLKNNLNMKIKFFILSSNYKPRKNSYLEFEKFNVEEDILNFKCLVNLLRNKENKIDEVLSLLKQNIIFPIDLNSFQKISNGYDEYMKETILEEIKETCEKFVPTSITYKCLEHLENKDLLILIGNPGVGKSYNSKFIIAKYLEKGYKLLYSSNKNLRDILTDYNHDGKFILFLDDIFGSNNINFMSSLTDEEIVSLLESNRGNLKIVINSRTSIFKDVIDKFDKIGRLGLKPFIIETKDFTFTEKARILIKHLQKSNIDNFDKKKMFDNIKGYISGLPKQLNIYRIIYHKHYDPRLIDIITNSNNFDPNEDYIDFVICNLDNPHATYDHAYNNNLNSDDRTILKAIYLKSTYKRNNEVNIDNLLNAVIRLDITEDSFYRSIKKLEQSFIVLYRDKNGKSVCKFYNPGVMDYCIEKFKSSKDISKFAEISEDKDELDNIIPNMNIDYKLKKEKIIKLNYNDFSRIQVLAPNIKNDKEFCDYLKKVIFYPDKSFTYFDEDYFCCSPFMEEVEIFNLLNNTRYINLYISFSKYGPSGNCTKIVLKFLKDFSSDQIDNIIRSIISEINDVISSEVKDYISIQGSADSCNENELKKIYYDITNEFFVNFQEYQKENRDFLDEKLIDEIKSKLKKFDINDYLEYINETFNSDDNAIDEKSDDDNEVIKIVDNFYDSIMV